MSRTAAIKWRDRIAQHDLAGLDEQPRRGSVTSWTLASNSTSVKNVNASRRRGLIHTRH